MSFESLDDWDEAFLHQAIQMEEKAIATSSTNLTQYQPNHHQPHQQQQQEEEEVGRPNTGFFDPPHAMVTASLDPFISFSPPRELSQRPTDTQTQKPTTIIAPRTLKPSQPPLTRRAGKEKQVETDKLKRSSKQLSELEQKCALLKKERHEVEQQLRSALTQIRDQDAEIERLKRINVEYGATTGAHNVSQLGDTLADIAGPRVNSALTSSKAVGIQTETLCDDPHLMRKNDPSSQQDLLKKLLSVWGYPKDQISAKELASKLVVTCAEDLHVLFRCMSMKISSNTDQDCRAGNEFSDLTSHDYMQSAQSVEAAKISRLYFLLTKMSNEMERLDSLFKALLDLCILENVVVVYRSLRILREILHHLLRFDRRVERSVLYSGTM